VRLGGAAPARWSAEPQCHAPPEGSSDAGWTIFAVSGIVFAIAALAASIVLVAGLAWASRRLLGLPVGAVRALIAGLLGFVAALLVGRALRATQSGHLAAFFTVALGVPLIVAMVFIVVAAALGAGSRARGATRRSAGSRSGTAWALTCAGGRSVAVTRPADEPRSRNRSGVPWRRAGLPSSSWASCCPLAVTCSLRSSLPSSPSFRIAPNRCPGSRSRR